MPANMKRNPKTGSAIWQLAATTTPATINPPSIFSTLNREIGDGHFNFGKFGRVASPVKAHDLKLTQITIFPYFLLIK